MNKSKAATATKVSARASTSSALEKKGTTKVAADPMVLLSKQLMKLPTELLLRILEYYGGRFAQPSNNNKKKFLMTFFGKFTKSSSGDVSPKFIFRKLEIDSRKPFLRWELLRLFQSMSVNQPKIAMRPPYSKILYDSDLVVSGNMDKALENTKKTLSSLLCERIFSLSSNYTALPPEALKMCLEQFKNLEVLILSQEEWNFSPKRKMFTLDLLNAVALSKLRVLKWTGGNLLDDAEGLIQLSKNTPNLTVLEVQSDFSIFRLAKALPNWQKLKSLKSVVNGVSFNQGWETRYDTVKPEEQTEFFDNLKLCTELSTLSFEREKILPTILKDTYDIANSSLKSVEFIECNMESAVSELFKITTLKKLKHRGFFNYNPDHTATTLVEPRCKNLEELTLQYPPFFDPQIFSNLPLLKTLKLENINNKNASTVVKCLPKLEMIDVSDSAITNDGIMVIANNCPKLKTIKAVQCKLVQMNMPKDVRDKIIS